MLAAKNCRVLILIVSIPHRFKHSFMGHICITSSNFWLSIHQSLWWGELFGDDWQLGEISRLVMALERILPSGRDRSDRFISK